MGSGKGGGGGEGEISTGLGGNGRDGNGKEVKEPNTEREVDMGSRSRLGENRVDEMEENETNGPEAGDIGEGSACNCEGKAIARESCDSLLDFFSENGPDNDGAASFDDNTNIDKFGFDSRTVNETGHYIDQNEHIISFPDQVENMGKSSNGDNNKGNSGSGDSSYLEDRSSV